MGGADQGRFFITSGTGELSFLTAPNYEDPTDVASSDPVSGARDNEYVVTVEVRSGAGARELTAEQTLTVRVTDEQEPPGIPDAPTFSGETADSLTVNWRKPDNTGPEIADYDVRYREKATGGFIDADHQGTGLSLTLSDLKAGTVYEVQVRARNEEGAGHWSQSGEGRTVGPLRLEMTTLEDPPVSGAFAARFSFSEPVTGFNASDIEAGQHPECRDDQNNTVFCEPVIGGLQTADDRVFTTTVIPQTGRVAHSYSLTLTVPGGRVRSLVGSKLNEEPEEPLEVRVSPPGAPEPISTLSLAAGAGNGSVRLIWNRPSDNGGSPIIRYEYRYRAIGEEWSQWEKVGAAARGVTVANLINGQEYVFELRAVNALGKGGVETVQAAPVEDGGGSGGGGAEEDVPNFMERHLKGTRLTLRSTGEEGPARTIEIRFRRDRSDKRFDQEATSGTGMPVYRSGNFSHLWSYPGSGSVFLRYDDDGTLCKISMNYTESHAGTFRHRCGGGDRFEGSFRLTPGLLFVPVILTSEGLNQSFFTSELTLTNRGDRNIKVDYTYTSHRGGGSGVASEILGPGRQRVAGDALNYLRGLGVPIPERGNRMGTLRMEVPLGPDVGAVVRTTTLVREGRAGLAYPGVAQMFGFDEPAYLCGLRQNSQDRSNVAFQNMGAPEDGAITLRATVYSGEAGDTEPRVLDEKRLEPGEFHQYSGLLGVLGQPAQGYVKVERLEGTAPFYAYGVINDQANSDGSFIFPVAESSQGEWHGGQILPVIVETRDFTSELTVTNFSEKSKTLNFEFVSEHIKGDDNTVGFSMTLEAGEQQIVPEFVEELRRQGMQGLGTTRGFYAGPLFVEPESGYMSGIVIGARTGSEGGGGQYSVFYTGVPEHEAFRQEAWVDGLQQNEENRSNLALVNTGEVDGSASIFRIEIYNGETGLLAETVVTEPIPARSWHQINGILLRSGPETRQGYIRIEKVSGENPFLAYGVVNDGGAPGKRSGDGAFLPARE